MRRQRELVRQISVAMQAVAIGCLMLTWLIFILVYLAVPFFAPKLIASDVPLIPSKLDMLTLFGSGIAASIIASLMAIKIAARIARPLQSVAESAQRIAKGDLSARVQPDQQAPKEVAMLIVDFNDMAERLEAMAQRIVTWNAQIAHELRTPITILTGRLQGAVDGVFEPDEKWVAGLLAQATLLRRLVEDLRAVSLADSGRLDLRLDEVELAGEIAALVDFVAPDLEAAGFLPELHLDAGKVSVDIARVRQALLALIENARHHALPGPLSIALRLTPRDAVIEVSDTGPGLPPDFAPHAFAEFARADTTRRLGVAGSGLGLSVVQAIARAHGGESHYRRTPKGSAFALRFPRKGKAPERT